MRVSHIHSLGDRAPLEQYQFLHYARLKYPDYCVILENILAI